MRIALFLLVSAFLIDISVPLGIAVGVLYIFPILSTLTFNRLQTTTWISITSGVLTLIGWTLSQEGGDGYAVATNRTLSVLAIIVTYWIVQRSITATKRLEAKEKQFRLVFESAPSGKTMINSHGTIVLANAMLCEQFGYEREALLGQSIETLIPERFRPQHPGHRTNFIAVSKPRTMGNGPELFGLRQDGTEFPVEIALSPLSTEQGSFVLASVLDITARKKAELAVRDRNTALALNVEIGTLINQNQDIQSILQGCSEAMVQHLDLALARIWTLNDVAQILELQASAGLYTHLNGAHSRVPVGQFTIGEIASEKQPHLTNAVIGDPRVPEQEWAEREGLVAFAGYPLMRGHEVFGVMGMFSRHSLTEQTLTNLQEIADRITTAVERHSTRGENQKLVMLNTQLLASVSDGIWGLDRQGQTTFVNPAAADILGYKPEELIGTHMHTLVHHTKPDGSPYPRE
ncbi:MAG: PAS domain S-box protein, partial [Nitrospirales bacterium]